MFQFRSLLPSSPFTFPLRVVAVTVAALLAPAAHAQSPVRVLTFNIRYGTANDGDHRWPNRIANVIATIRDHAPHILGLQEALRSQLDEIGHALPGYREFGVGRDDGKTAGEYAALLIDTTRFGVVRDGHFWYSDTPEVPGSKSWGNNVTRICTWVRLVDRATGDTIRVYNSHWDHESQPSREKSAGLLITHITTDPGRRDRVLVMADFNSDEENEAFKTLVSDPRSNLHDTYRELHPDALNVGTYHGFKGDSTGGKIDAILASRGWTTLDAMIDHRKFGALWASDHFAVSATLRSGASGGGVATFEPMPSDRFPSRGLSASAFTDFDNDNDVDALIVQASGAATLLDRRGAVLNEVTRYAIPNRGIAAAAWANITRPEFPPIDRFPDLALALNDSGVRLFHNRGSDPNASPELRWNGIEEMTKSGVNVPAGKARLLRWIDFDGDFDTDLFVGFADRPPMLFAAKTVSGVQGSVQFTDLSPSIFKDAKPITTAVWVDYDQDGDLDLITGGARGLPNVLYRNTEGALAAQRPRTSEALDWAGREEGKDAQYTTAICVADVNTDGLFDLFLTNHGRAALLLGRGGGTFDDASRAWGVNDIVDAEACAFGDIDNDGKPDLFVGGAAQQLLFRNLGDRFAEITPPAIGELADVTAAQWFDVDHDGDVDLVLSGSGSDTQSVFENGLEGEAQHQGIDVRVRDIQDYMTLTGAEIRIYSTKGDRLIASGIVGDGSGGGSQSDVPVHLATGDDDEVDVEVSFPKGNTRVQLRIQSVSVKAYRDRALIMRIPPSGKR